jgi:hypothetical protein
MAMATDAERLACMRGALAAEEAARGQTAPSSAASSPAAPSRAPAAAAAPPSAAIAAPAPVARMDDDDDGFLGLGIFGGGDDDAPQQTAGAATGLGADAVNFEAGEAPGPQGRQQATIVSFREHVPGIMEFELDNGQVWRQISGDGQDVNLRDGQSVPVEMWTSWAGGYRMRLADNQNLTVRVERIR